MFSELPSSKSVTRLFAVLTVGLILFAAIFSYALVSLNNVSNDIQAQRLTLCQDQNTRHDNTINILDDILAKSLRRPHLSAQKRLEIEQSKAPTLFLINALVPHRDCSAEIH